MYGLKASPPILKEKIKFSHCRNPADSTVTERSRSDQDQPSPLVEQTDIVKP